MVYLNDGSARREDRNNGVINFLSVLGLSAAVLSAFLYLGKITNYDKTKKSNPLPEPKIILRQASPEEYPLSVARDRYQELFLNSNTPVRIRDIDCDGVADVIEIPIHVRPAVEGELEKEIKNPIDIQE